MFGRFALFASGGEVAERSLAAGTPPLDSCYNNVPKQAGTAVRSTNRMHRFVQIWWGLIPSGATDPAIGHRLINARAEMVAE